MTRTLAFIYAWVGACASEGQRESVCVCVCEISLNGDAREKRKINSNTVW